MSEKKLNTTPKLAKFGVDPKSKAGKNAGKTLDTIIKAAEALEEVSAEELAAQVALAAGAAEVAKLQSRREKIAAAGHVGIKRAAKEDLENWKDPYENTEKKSWRDADWLKKENLPAELVRQQRRREEMREDSRRTEINLGRRMRLDACLGDWRLARMHDRVQPNEIMEELYSIAMVPGDWHESQDTLSNDIEKIEIFINDNRIEIKTAIQQLVSGEYHPASTVEELEQITNDWIPGEEPPGYSEDYLQRFGVFPDAVLSGYSEQPAPSYQEIKDVMSERLNENTGRLELARKFADGLSVNMVGEESAEQNAIFLRIADISYELADLIKKLEPPKRKKDVWESTREQRRQELSQTGGLVRRALPDPPTQEELEEERRVAFRQGIAEVITEQVDDADSERLNEVQVPSLEGLKDLTLVPAESPPVEKSAEEKSSWAPTLVSLLVAAISAAAQEHMENREPDTPVEAKQEQTQEETVEV